MTKHEKLQRQIASILDHPSVYMGGPSQHNLRVALRVLTFLEREGALTAEASAVIYDRSAAEKATSRGNDEG